MAILSLSVYAQDENINENEIIKTDAAVNCEDSFSVCMDKCQSFSSDEKKVEKCEDSCDIKFTACLENIEFP